MPVMCELEVEGAAAGKVGRQVQPDAQVVRPPGFVVQVEQQAFAGGGAHDAIVAAQIVTAGCQAACITFGLGSIEGLAGLRFELRRQALRVGARGAFERHEAQFHRLAQRRPMCVAPCGKSGGVERECAQSRQAQRSGGAAALKEVGGFVEVARAHVFELGFDQQVDTGLEQRDAALHVLLGQDVDHLRRQPDHRAEAFAPADRRADIHRDDDIGAHPACDVDRQVVHQATVAEDAPAAVDRRKNTGHAHARSQRGGEVTAVELDRGAGFHIGGNGAKWNRQFVEALDVAHRQRVAAQQRLQPAAGHGGLRQAQFTIAQAEFDHRRDLEVLFLAPLRQFASADTLRKNIVPAHREQLAFDLLGAHAGGIQAADDRAHRGADDDVHRHPFALEHLEHADMRQAAGATARQHQADARARRCGLGLGALRQHRHRHSADQRRDAEAEDQGGMQAAQGHRPIIGGAVAGTGAAAEPTPRRSRVLATPQRRLPAMRGAMTAIAS